MNTDMNDKELVSKTSGFGKSLEGEQKWPPVMYKVPVRMVGVDMAEEGEDKTVVTIAQK